MSYLVKNLAIIAMILGLEGCTFEPLSRQFKGNYKQDFISIDTIPNRSGQLLRESLRDHFKGIHLSNDERTYRLKVTLEEQSTYAGFRRDLTPRYARCVLKAKYTLYDGRTGGEIITGVARAYTNYTIPDRAEEAAISALTAERSSKGHAINTLAENITRQVQSHLSE